MTIMKPVRMILLMTLCLLMIILCLYLPDYYQAVRNYQNGLTPKSCLGVHAKDDIVLHDDQIQRVYRFDPAFTLMGLSFNFEHYKNNETLFIFDESQNVQNIIYGRKFNNNDEIVIPLNTAKKLNRNVQSLINKTICVYYKHGYKVRGKKVKISGIAETVSYDAIYIQKDAHLIWQKELFKSSPKAYYALVYVKGDMNKIRKRLEKRYPLMTFRIIGEGKNQENHTLSIILYIVTVFLILLLLYRLKLNHCTLSQMMMIHTFSFILSILAGLLVYALIIRMHSDAINQHFRFPISSFKLIILYIVSLSLMILKCLTDDYL